MFVILLIFPSYTNQQTWKKHFFIIWLGVKLTWAPNLPLMSHDPAHSNRGRFHAALAYNQRLICHCSFQGVPHSYVNSRPPVLYIHISSNT